MLATSNVEKADQNADEWAANTFQPCASLPLEQQNSLAIDITTCLKTIEISNQLNSVYLTWKNHIHNVFILLSSPWETTPICYSTQTIISNPLSSTNQTPINPKPHYSPTPFTNPFLETLVLKSPSHSHSHHPPKITKTTYLPNPASKPNRSDTNPSNYINHPRTQNPLSTNPHLPPRSTSHATRT